MVNILQNISQNREDQKIKKDDLKRAFALAWQTVYPGKTMFGAKTVFSFGHVPLVEIYYVTSSEEGKASCEWRNGMSTREAKTSVSQISCSNYTTKHAASSVRFLKNVDPSKIYKSLKITPNEEGKIIIESMILKEDNWKNLNGISTIKQVMGLYLAEPSKMRMDSFSYLFHSVVIFTPRLGLFNKTPPQ